MGKRLLRATILRPLMDAQTLEARYEAVGEAHRDLLRREEIRRAFCWNSGSGAAVGAAEPGFGRAAGCAGVGREPAQAAGAEDAHSMR